MSIQQNFDSQFLVDQLNWRYAVKKFDVQRKISESDWEVLSESLRLAASSYGLQPWKFIVVQNPEVRKKLTPVSWGQSQISECSHLVVFTTLKRITEQYVQRYVNHIAQVRGQASEQLNGYRDMMVKNLVKGSAATEIQSWTQRQSYIAMGSMMTAAALMSIDTCAIEGLDPKKYDEILGLTNTEYSTVAVVALGYRHAEDKYQHAKKVRFHRSDIVEVLK